MLSRTLVVREFPEQRRYIAGQEEQVSHTGNTLLEIKIQTLCQEYNNHDNKVWSSKYATPCFCRKRPDEHVSNDRKMKKLQVVLYSQLGAEICC